MIKSCVVHYEEQHNSKTNWKVLEPELTAYLIPQFP